MQNWLREMIWGHPYAWKGSASRDMEPTRVGNGRTQRANWSTKRVVTRREKAIVFFETLDGAIKERDVAFVQRLGTIWLRAIERAKAVSAQIEPTDDEENAFARSIDPDLPRMRHSGLTRVDYNRAQAMWVRVGWLMFTLIRLVEHAIAKEHAARNNGAVRDPRNAMLRPPTIVVHLVDGAGKRRSFVIEGPDNNPMLHPADEYGAWGGEVL